MKVLSDLLLYLLAAAFIQNFILTTGFGSSIMLRIVRRPKDILLFSGLLAGFSLLTVLIGYPCDRLMGTGQLAKLIRPGRDDRHRGGAVHPDRGGAPPVSAGGLPAAEPAARARRL